MLQNHQLNNSLFILFLFYRMCSARNGREMHAFTILKMKFLRTLQTYWVMITCSAHCYICGVYLSFICGETSDMKRKKIIKKKFIWPTTKTQGWTNSDYWMVNRKKKSLMSENYYLYHQSWSRRRGKYKKKCLYTEVGNSYNKSKHTPGQSGSQMNTCSSSGSFERMFGVEISLVLSHF